MRKFLSLIMVCGIIASCSTWFSDDYENLTCCDTQENCQRPAVKERGDYFVTYEYKDMRVDDLLPLAQAYCADINADTQAKLREVVLHRSHLRRATFDCVYLAMPK